MSDPYQVVREFERALCEYTGARFAVTVTSCTAALLLCCAWFRRTGDAGEFITIPRRTYVGVAQSILNAGLRVRFADEQWRGGYQMRSLPVWDYARRFTSEMYRSSEFQCVSFHHTKILGLASHGGAILHDSAQADRWLRRARFDGRTEGVDPRQDKIQHPAWHCYMTPPTAAEGLLRLAGLPAHNEDLPNSDYADLSMMEIFR